MCAVCGGWGVPCETQIYEWAAWPSAQCGIENHIPRVTLLVRLPRVTLLVRLDQSTKVIGLDDWTVWCASRVYHEYMWADCNTYT